jgi:hypothetical protein
MNGAAVANAAGTVPSSQTTLHLGNLGGAYNISGGIERVIYWPQRISNADLQTLSGA